MHHVTLERHKTPYKRPRFNVGWKPTSVKGLTVVSGVGTAPEAELGGVIGARPAPEADLKVVIGRKSAPEADLRR